jgi:ATP synthase protein I
MADDTSRDGPVAEPHLGAETAWTVLSYLITGPLIFGGLGWLLDRWAGTDWIVAVGLVIGMGLSLYVIVLRYVAPQQAVQPKGGTDSDQGG